MCAQVPAQPNTVLMLVRSFRNRAKSVLFLVLGVDVRLHGEALSRYPFFCRAGNDKFVADKTTICLVSILVENSHRYRPNNLSSV